MPPCLMSVPRARSQQLLRFLFFMVVHCLMCRIRYKQSSQNFLQLIPTRESTTHKKTVFLLSAKFDVSPNDLDVEKIDLIGWSSQLVLFQRQMLMIMGSTLVIQDRALQYEYLQPPTPLGTFSFINLQLVILYQAQTITKGLIVQPTPASQPEPIVFEVHGVQSESLNTFNTLHLQYSP